MAQTQRLESLGILAGGIAHDFNNLLTVISGNSEMLRMTVSEIEHADKYLNHIDESCGYAADLCRQMLAYAGQSKLAVGAFDLSELVDSMGSLIQSSADSHVKIRMDLLGSSLVTVKADATQIKQVVLNVIVNAVEAIGQRDGEIDLRTYTTYLDQQQLKDLFNGEAIKAGEYGVFEVRDTGCGMSGDLQRKIFDPFVTTKATGSGLGLSAVLGVVQAHQGGLKLQSQEKKGTTIAIYLPVAEREKEDVILSHEDKGIEAWAGGSLALIVDDEDMVQEVFGFFCPRNEL
ncbi:MAG: ATP-binding protein [Ghiorsea sp.]|nr:ATP-binding protein [Ghiorsea sp.]